MWPFTTHVESDPKRIVVTNLSPATTNESLKRAFDDIGWVIDAKVLTSRDRGPFGFVQYYDPADAAKAIRRMNGARVDGSRVHVEAYECRFTVSHPVRRRR